MNDHLSEVTDNVNLELAPPSAGNGFGAEAEQEETVAKLRRSMADFEAGRYRPARDVLREIAAEEGIPFND